VYDANIQLALQLSRSTEASLLIEAMNPVDVPAALVPSSDAAAAVIDAHRDPRLGLQFDIYHTAMGREEPLSVFARHAALVRHVQFADAPGRHEPGTGRLNIPEILGGIARAGYAGWYGAEYRPSGVTSDGLGWIATLHPGTAA
jgi:hydroxypyruvate isomerase